MASEEKETPRQQFNVESNRAHSTQGERKKFNDPTIASFTEDRVENGERIGRMMIPRAGVISDLSIFIEDMNMNDAKIEIVIEPDDMKKTARIYRRAVSKGSNEFDDLQVNDKDRLTIELKDLQDTVLKGVWVAFTYKQGG